MAIREILRYPNPTLRKTAEPVAEVTDEVRVLIDDLAETMYFHNGMGLAAPQIGVLRRVFVVDVAHTPNLPSGQYRPSELMAFVNPVILSAEGTTRCPEACLSLLGINEEVRRATRVTIEALGYDGQPVTLLAEHLLAVAIQHEYDHLDGKMFIDRLSFFKRSEIERRLRKAGHQ